MIQQEWKVAGYIFRFRKGGPCRFGTLSVFNDEKLPLPYHLVCQGIGIARRLAPSLVSAFEQGLTPDEGVFYPLAKGQERPRFRYLVKLRVR